MIRELIRPTFDRILVKRLEAPTVDGSLIIPDGAREPQSEGIIVATGPLVFSREQDEAALRSYLNEGGTDAQFIRHQTFNVGDKVGFGKYAGNPVVVNKNEEFLLLHAREIQHVVVSVEVGGDAAVADAVEVIDGE